MPYTLTLLLIIGIILLLVLLLVALLSFRRLGRIERQLKGSQPVHGQSEQTSGVSGVDSPSGSAFEEFLSEDPERLALPKSEQFAEFRKWRKEKGMNWSGS